MLVKSGVVRGVAKIRKEEGKKGRKLLLKINAPRRCKGQARLVKKEGRAIHFWKCILIASAALFLLSLEIVLWSECLYEYAAYFPTLKKFHAKVSPQCLVCSTL